VSCLEARVGAPLGENGKKDQTLMMAKSVTSWYLKKQMELMITVNVLTYDIRSARRKGIILRLYIIAVVKDASVVNVDGGQGNGLLVIT